MSAPARRFKPQRHPAPMDMLRAEGDPVDTLRRCGRTFYAASLLLPSSVRRELGVLYAFCRLVDDCGDEPLEGGSHAARALLDEIARNLEGRVTTSPVVAAFLDLAARRDIPLTLAWQLIDGVRSDLGPVRVDTEGTLVRYAYRVASTVGLMICRVLGVPSDGDRFAIDLGIAMQMTNIARDVREDAASDRVYLPGTWVDPQSVLMLADGAGSIRDIHESRLSTTNAVQRVLALADQYYDSAELGMRYLPMRVRPGIRAAASSYRAVGTVIRRDPAGALASRASTSAPAKAARSLSAVIDSIVDGLPVSRACHDDRLHAPLLAMNAATGGS